jgi:hypothetical protein
VPAETMVAAVDAGCSEVRVVTCAGTVLYRDVVVELRVCVG